jgi:hypothetical protein
MEERFLSSRLPAKPETQPDYYSVDTGIKPTELETLSIKDIQKIWIYKPTSHTRLWLGV